MLRYSTAALFFLGISSLLGEPVDIPDGSFNSRSLNAGSWSNNIAPWLETNGPSSGNGFVEHISGFSAVGQNHLGMELNHDVWQDLPVLYEPNTRYTLTVAVGHRSGRTNSNNQSEFYLADADGFIHASGVRNASSIPAGTFTDASPVVFETSPSHPAVDRPIRILLRARGGGRSHFDNIRLVTETLVPSGGAELANPNASLVGSNTATLSVDIADPGISNPGITFFWGATDGGINPDAWEFSQSLPGTHLGSAALTITNLAPGGTYRFTARAENAAGFSWLTPSATFETLSAPPEVATLEADNVTAFSASLRADVLNTGGSPPTVTIHYGPIDGGTNPDAWQGTLDAGSGEGIQTATLTALDPATTWFFRASATNDVGTVWAAESRTFTTLGVFPPAVEIQTPTGITGASATLRGTVTETGNATPQITMFLGTVDGGSDPSQWQMSFNLGLQGGAFGVFAASLDPETTYHYRARASNQAGTAWSPTTGSFTTTALVASSVVINEFHYKPADESTLGEFIELHNPGDETADISNWRLSNAISYSFPPGTIIPPGGYLVVAQDPAVILNQYGVTAIGPYSGGLSAKGERINLRDQADNLVDRVEYAAGFPWPAAPDGGGPSVERIHPSLDGNLAGSWRASGTIPDGDPPTPLIPLQESGWRFFRGTSEASSPIQAWRDSNFDDATWETGQAPVGYGVAGLNTTISGMRYNYSTIYLRKEFTVPAGTVPQTVNARLYLDDGCVIWINGTEVHRRLAPAGDLPFNALASTFVSAPQWYEFTIENADEILFGGTNTIAVHLLNSSLSSSDLAFDIELVDAATANPGRPTPGARNSVFTAPELVPPHIDQVSHSPQSPQSGEPVTISARIIDPDGVATANLAYQTVEPGTYIRLTDPAYQTDWTTVPMTTDGTGVWTATLPPDLQQHRHLIRYKIGFSDTLGNSQTVPYPDDESPNFAYFVDDGVPAWQGAFRPGQTPLRTFTTETLTSIPVYTLIAADNDVINSQYNSSFNKVRMTGTFVHNGIVHDHVEFRNRGEGSIYQAGKNKWRFYFNRGARFQAADADGNDYQETWKQFSGNPGAAAWAPLNRGATGIDEMVPFRAYQLAGVPSPHTHHYHFRVIRGAVETPQPGTTQPNSIGNADAQYHGDFWGVYLAIEPIRGNFLSERNLPNGNIYKIEGNNGDKKEQAPGQPADSADWIAFRNTHVNSNPTETWWRDNLDLDAYYSFHTINRLVGNVDLRPGANHYFYHRSSDGRWVPIPWDLDMMFLAKHHWGSVEGVPDVIHAHKAIIHHPQIALEFRNRAREILDLLASDATPDGGQIGQLIAEISGRVHSPGAIDSLAWADAHLWNLHPRTRGTDGNASGQGNHRGNFFRSPFNDSRSGGSWTRWLRDPAFTGTGTPDDTFAYFLNYATNTWPGGSWTFNNGDQRGYGYQAVLAEAADQDIPHKPAITYTGGPGFPSNQLSVTSSAFSDPQGDHTFAAREWRIAEIGAPGLYEINAAWSATSTTSSETTVNLPSANVMPGRLYRARVRHQDNTGRWSHWSDPVEFTATPGTAALVHYWNFNSSSAPLAPTQTAGSADLSVTGTHETGTGQDFTATNARFGDPASRHLRVNNPLTPGTRIDLVIPSTGFSDIIVNYETRRSGQGAGIQHISYTTDGETFIDFTTVEITESPAITEIDFRDMPATADNPNLAIRITFSQGEGGTGGNNRFDNLSVEGVPLDPSPRLIPVGNAPWNFPENWHHLTIPDAPGATAIVGPPENGNRNVSLTAPATIGELIIETGDTPFRNRLNGDHSLTLDNNGLPASLSVTGGGEGFAELQITGDTHLASGLILDVQHIGGDPEHGALRLRQAWSGAGDVVKQGFGMASLTGGDKNLTGAVFINQGVLRFTASSAPPDISGLNVANGGQLRLSSTGTRETPAIHQFGGDQMIIAGAGRDGVPTGQQLGILGALRYEPYSDADHHALLTNPIVLSDDASVHVAGGSNSLTLASSVTGPFSLTKSGGGSLVLASGETPDDSPEIVVNNGTVELRAIHNAAIHLQEDGILTGNGTLLANVSGPGSVVVANETLLANSSTVAHVAAVLSNTGSSGNGTLFLADLSNPLPIPPQSIAIFLNPTTQPLPGDRFLGGIITAHNFDLESALSATTVSLFLADPTGEITHLGQTYRVLSDDDPFTWNVNQSTMEVLRSGKPASYDQWRNLNFPDPEDRNNDEISGPLSSHNSMTPNLFRYAFSLDHQESPTAYMPVLNTTDHTFRFPFYPAKNDLAWIVRASENLTDWDTVLFDSRNDPVPETASNGWASVPYPNHASRLFLRLELMLID